MQIKAGFGWSTRAAPRLWDNCKIGGGGRMQPPRHFHEVGIELWGINFKVNPRNLTAPRRMIVAKGNIDE